jgi:hypothetical protein
MKIGDFSNRRGGTKSEIFAAAWRHPWTMAVPPSCVQPNPRLAFVSRRGQRLIYNNQHFLSLPTDKIIRQGTKPCITHPVLCVCVCVCVCVSLSLFEKAKTETDSTHNSSVTNRTWWLCVWRLLYPKHQESLPSFLPFAQEQRLYI